jgi:hypothetical protein
MKLNEGSEERRGEERRGEERRGEECILCSHDGVRGLQCQK